MHDHPQSLLFHAVGYPRDSVTGPYTCVGELLQRLGGVHEVTRLRLAGFCPERFVADTGRSVADVDRCWVCTGRSYDRRA